jgi:hypothetical protein
MFLGIATDRDNIALYIWIILTRRVIHSQTLARLATRVYIRKVSVIDWYNL